MLITVALATGAGGLAEYARTLSLSALDQAAFDAETYGEKKGLKREADGLRMTLAPGEAETGWKTPQQVRFGGDFHDLGDRRHQDATQARPGRRSRDRTGDRVSRHQPA